MFTLLGEGGVDLRSAGREFRDAFILEMKLCLSDAKMIKPTAYSGTYNLLAPCFGIRNAKAAL